MTSLEKTNILLVQKKNTLSNSGFERIPIRRVQDAVDFIIHYNPKVVMVGNSMTDLEIAKLKLAVCPWFSGKILKNDH